VHPGLLAVSVTGGLVGTIGALIAARHPKLEPRLEPEQSTPLQRAPSPE